VITAKFPMKVADTPHHPDLLHIGPVAKNAMPLAKSQKLSGRNT
jgi:hypothetical protein